MNIRSSHPPDASDFKPKAPDSARQNGDEDEFNERGAQEILTSQFESSVARDVNASGDADAAEPDVAGASDDEAIDGAKSDASPEQDAMPTNYAGLNEEAEDDEIDGDEDDGDEPKEVGNEEVEGEEVEGEEVEGEEVEGEEAKADEGGKPQNKRATPGRGEFSSRDVNGREANDHAEFERIFLQWKATDDPRLRERLILMNRSMVMFLARRFMDRGELFEDVMQVGMLGLIYALDGYDMDRGVKFSTFAIPTISGEIRRYFRDKVSGMRVPRGLQELHATLQTRIEELTQQLDRSPTYAEIAFSLKIEVEQVVEAMELGAAIDPLSIDDRVYGEESATIAESVGAPDPQLHAYEEHAALQAALEKLPAQERRVLEMSYFDGHSQAEIARRMNVSQMHISRLLRRSLAQLRQLLEEA